MFSAATAALRVVANSTHAQYGTSSQAAAFDTFQKASIVSSTSMSSAAMIAFWKVSKTAAWLLAPYWAWLLFATTLNAAAAMLNG